MELAYPNLASELTKSDIDSRALCAAVADHCGQPVDIASQWLNGSLSLPTQAAFFVRDRYFPTMTVEYLFER